MLKYTGKGFLYGIPARDLTEEEAEKIEGGIQFLLSTGLWVKEERKAPSDKMEPKPKIENKEVK
jgi:uncharacterized membrane protein